MPVTATNTKETWSYQRSNLYTHPNECIPQVDIPHWIHYCITVTINIRSITQIALAERMMTCDRKPLTKLSQICMLCSLQLPYCYTQVIKPCSFNLGLEILASHCTSLKSLKGVEKSTKSVKKSKQQCRKSSQKPTNTQISRTAGSEIMHRIQPQKCWLQGIKDIAKWR